MGEFLAIPTKSDLHDILGDKRFNNCVWDHGAALCNLNLKSVWVINRHLELLSDGARIKYENFLWKPLEAWEGSGWFHYVSKWKCTGVMTNVIFGVPGR